MLPDLRSSSLLARLAFTLLLTSGVAAVSRAAWAHAVGLSRGEYTLVGDQIVAELAFARADVEGLDGARLIRGVVVTSGGAPCSARAEGTTRVADGALLLATRFVCESPRGRVEVRIAALEDLPEGHRHAARIRSSRGVAEDVLYRGHDTASFEWAREESPTPRPLARATTAVARLAGMASMGVGHILGGYDHLVFLLGLVLVGGRRRALLAMVSAFTAGHSVTLACAALGLWAPPSRWVEAGIALSIAYVGVQNFFLRAAASRTLERSERADAKVEGRWRVALPFGLLHGFGFAGALRDIAIPRAEVPLALLGFNTGVEVGQLAVLAALLPLLAWLRSSRALARFDVVRVLSAAVAAAGSLWFVVRVL